MSASLVGSEMCIRDRRRIARQDFGPIRRGASLKRGGDILTRECFNKRWNCLLYTSDAADDM
eukprot:8944802-Alexandrium_andersonii.AAC.1